MPLEPDELGLDADSFGRVLDVGRRLGPDDFERAAPPDDLWDRISAELRADDQPRTLSVVDELDAPSPGGTGRVAPGAARWFRPLAIAAAVVLAAATVGVVSQLGGEERQELAAVELEVLREGTGSAEAALVQVDGVDHLVVDLADVPPAPDGRHYELWLIDVDVTDPVSLGEVPDGSGTVEVPVPEGVDPGAYPVVDINLQEDGVAAHSGPETSVLRGVLA